MTDTKRKPAHEGAPQRFDATLKELLQAAPPRLMQMLTGSQPVELLTVEFPKVRMRRPDYVARLKDGRIYHLEIQSDNEVEMAWRMLDYYTLLRRLYGQPPVQQVLYIGDAPLTMVAEIAEATLSFHYELIDIRQLDGQALLASRSLEDNLLALLCRTADPQQTVRRIFSKLDRLPAKMRRDRLTQMLMLSSLRNLTDLILEEVETMTDLDEALRNSKVGQKWVREEAARLLTRQLETLFGKLPRWAKQKIAAAEATQLDDWAVRLLKAKTLEEVLR